MGIVSFGYYGQRRIEIPIDRIPNMETILKAEAFNLEWEFSHGFVGRLRPLDYSSPDGDWEYCEVAYRLLPLNGRHVNARCDLRLSVSKESSNVENEVSESSASAEFELDTWWQEDREFHFVIGVLSGNEIFEHSHRRADLEATLDDFEEYDYVQLRLDYDEAASREQLTDRSPEDAREDFVEFMDREGENPTEVPF